MRRPANKPPQPTARGSWERDIGPIPARHRLWRTCGEDRCVRPEHHVLVPWGQPEPVLLVLGDPDHKGHRFLNRSTSESSKRAVWQEVFGTIDRQMTVYGTCSEKKCCSPEHLSLIPPGRKRIDVASAGWIPSPVSRAERISDFCAITRREVTW